MKPLVLATLGNEHEHHAFDPEAKALWVRGARRRRLNFETAREPHFARDRFDERWTAKPGSPAQFMPWRADAYTIRPRRYAGGAVKLIVSQRGDDWFRRESSRWKKRAVVSGATLKSRKQK